jgi:signal transduction histidine kinase
MFRRAFFLIFALMILGPLLGAILATAVGAAGGVSLWVVVAVILVLITVLLFGARRFFGRSLAPVSQLIDATQRLGDGETGVRIKIDRPGPLAAVNGSFNRMAERLEDEDERRRRLLADLGHELRTPLTVIRGEIEAVIDGVHDPESLSNVIDEVRLMERLIDDLRVLALAEAGSLQLHREATDLGSLVTDVVASFSVATEAQGIQVRIEPEPGLPTAEVDSHRIHQVVSNLISNAVKQMPDGGMLTIELRRWGDLVSIVVSDTGPGIPEDRIGDIFDRFVRGGDTAGTGLGLSIARDLVEVHGGSIEVANRAEGGAVFTITLPRLSPQRTQ